MPKIWPSETTCSTRKVFIRGESQPRNGISATFSGGPVSEEELSCEDRRDLQPGRTFCYLQSFLRVKCAQITTCEGQPNIGGAKGRSLNKLKHAVTSSFPEVTVPKMTLPNGINAWSLLNCPLSA